MEITNITVMEEVNHVLTEFHDLTSSFTSEEINIVPYTGSWTAGQLGKHVVMSNSGFVEMLDGPTTETKREPDKLVGKIKEDFLNFNIRMEAPDSVRPAIIEYKKEDLLNELEKIKSMIKKEVVTLDLTKTCVSFELPVYGFLTRLEAVFFVIYHTQRHVHQLKKIRQAVVSS